MTAPSPTAATSARIAAAPISWGILDVPGWGHQMAPSRVLSEMAKLGFTATEFGSTGFLPQPPAAKATLLAAHGLGAVGSFLPVVLHDPAHDPLPEVRRELQGYADSGATSVVLAAATGAEGFDAPRPALDQREWSCVYRNLDRARAVASDMGITAALHPHLGTMVETAEEVQRVVDGCDTLWCLDTGHLIIGGTDPVAFARSYASRISHVHLKDVDLAVARRVTSGAISFHAGCGDGLFVPLGQGDVDVAAIVASLSAVGYTGWYVLEQDTVLDAEPPLGEGPAREAAASLAHLTTLLAALPSAASAPASAHSPSPEGPTVTTPAPTTPAGVLAPHVPAGSTATATLDVVITPETAGWGFSSLWTATLGAEELEFSTGQDEVVVVPLTGPVDVIVDDDKHALRGRASVFAGPTDVLYAAQGSALRLSGPEGTRVAIAGARVGTDAQRLPVWVRLARDTPAELRGAGHCTREVHGFAGPDAPGQYAMHKLIAVEVITPGGNWSSYPPHKHDEASAHESVLEEIYYYEVAPGPSGEPGVGYHRTYSTPAEADDVLAEVRSGDVVLVPRGWHGPCMAAPGNHLYYLNVMAGPGAGREWKVVDDADHAWVRQSWAAQTPDARLPLT